MSISHDLERRLVDHYAAEAPERAPDWVLQRILAAVDSRPQRRSVPVWAWRTSARLQPVTFAVTAVAIAAVGLVALTVLWRPGVGPATSPSPSPSLLAPSLISPSLLSTPAPGYSRFISTLHGITLDYPTPWQVRPAGEPWGNDGVGFAATDTDVIYDPTLEGDLFIGVASAALGTQSVPPGPDFGLGKATRMCDGANWGGQGKWGGGAGRSIELARLSLPSDGVRGWAGYCTDQLVTTNWYLFVATATRGYVVYLHVGDQSRTPSYDERWFDALLKTVDLVP